MAVEELALETRQQGYLQELGNLPGSYTQWLEQLPAEKRKRVRQQIARTKHGVHIVAPITCTGLGNCPFASACPIPDRGIDHSLVAGPDSDYPIGQHCVLEGEYTVQKTAEYLIHLDVDPSNPVETAMVQELALIDLQKNRALLIMSHGDREGQGRDFLHIDESVTGFSQHGPLVSKTTKLHPVLTYIDVLERRREKLLDKLMETRKAKADWAAKMGNTSADSRMLTEITEMRAAVSRMLEQQAQAVVAPQVEDLLIGLDEEL
jgi:hypothetical protein